MAHAVSAFHERTDHMPPVAALLAAVLHAATAAALFWVSPLNRQDLEENTIEVTIEQPKPPPEPLPVQEAVTPPPTPPAPPSAPAPTPPAAAEAAPPPPPAAAAKAEPKPAQKAASKDPLGVAPPAPVAPEPKQKDEPAPQPPTEATVEPPKPPEPPEAKPQPPQEAAAAPAEPPLEKVVPPVEAPPAPLTMRDFVKVLPPPSVPQAPRPQQLPRHSPLSPAPASPQNSSSAAVPSFVNPAEEATHTRAKNAYLLQVLRKFGQFLPNLRDKNEGGTVVLRFVIARDGRLVEASILKSSGVMALDKGMLDTLRAGSPYPPLPPDIPESQVVFVQPITARQ